MSFVNIYYDNHLYEPNPLTELVGEFKNSRSIIFIDGNSLITPNTSLAHEIGHYLGLRGVTALFMPLIVV